MTKVEPDIEQVHELLQQALATEQGGIKVYETAIECAIDEDLKQEWSGYLEETREHERVLRGLFGELGLDPEADSPGKNVVAHIGDALVAAMEMARESADPDAAQRVAAECVVFAETKDHMNWELLGKLVEGGKFEGLQALRSAHEQVEPEEDHHLYHTTGWARELWIQALGLPAVLPPPEERKNVETAIGAARAQQARKRML